MHLRYDARLTLHHDSLYLINRKLTKFKKLWKSELPDLHKQNGNFLDIHCCYCIRGIPIKYFLCSWWTYFVLFKLLTFQTFPLGRTNLMVVKSNEYLTDQYTIRKPTNIFMKIIHHQKANQPKVLNTTLYVKYVFNKTFPRINCKASYKFRFITQKTNANDEDIMKHHIFPAPYLFYSSSSSSVQKVMLLSERILSNKDINPQK